VGGRGTQDLVPRWGGIPCGGGGGGAAPGVRGIPGWIFEILGPGRAKPPTDVGDRKNPKGILF